MEHSQEWEGRLNEIEKQRDEAFKELDFNKVFKLAETFEQGELAALRDFATPLSQAEKFLTSGDVEQAASCLAEVAERFTKFVSDRFSHRWWDPRVGLEKIVDAAFSTTLNDLLESPHLIKALSRALSILQETLHPLEGEEGLEFSFSHLAQLKKNVQCVQVLSSKGVDTPDIALLGESLSEHVVKHAEPIVECARRSLQLEKFFSLSSYFPAVEAALLLEEFGERSEALLQFAKWGCLAALDGKGSSTAAQLALDRLLREPIHKSFVENFVRSLIEMKHQSDEPGDSYSWGLALLLLSDTTEKADGLALISRDCLNRANGQAAEDGEFENFYDLSKKEVGHKLSTWNLDSMDHYAAATFLAPLLSGTFDAEALCSYEGEAEVLKRNSASIPVSPVRVLRIALSAVMSNNQLKEELAIDEVVAIVDRFNGQLMLRPTRKDVSEDFCLQELLLRGVLQVAMSHEEEAIPMRKCLVRAIESRRLGVCRNIWWASDLKIKLFDEGLDRKAQEQADARALHLSYKIPQDAEERDEEATAEILSLLQKSPDEARPRVEAWLKKLDARFLDKSEEIYSELSSNARVPMSALRKANDSLAPLLLNGHIPGVPAIRFLVEGKTKGQPVLTVGLTEGDSKTCERVAQILKRIVPVPFRVTAPG